ncbi:MAG: type II toxin-antitoxin system PemK/MazF family toxin [Streptosporangiaceae bacterium]
MRGDIYRLLRVPKDVRGHEQRGPRYAVVLQADHLSALSTWLVAPTSTSAPGRSFRPEIDVNGTATRVVVDQMTAVDHQSRLGEFKGRLSLAEMVDVDRAVRIMLGIA